MPTGLPDEVLQGLGLLQLPLVQPDPIADLASAAPEPELGVQVDAVTGAAPATPVPAVEPKRGEFVVPEGAFGSPGAIGALPQVDPAPMPAPLVKPSAAVPSPARGPAAPMTPAQALARAEGKQAQADATAAEAIVAQRDAQVGQAREELAAHEAFSAQEKQIDQQRKALDEEATKVRAEKQAFVAQAMADVDNFRVDHNKYAKEMGLGGTLGWGIAMVLSEVGNALQGKKGENPVLAMLQQRMHQAVVQQVDERDRLKQRSVNAKHDLDKYDQYTKDRQALIDLLDARNEKRLANMIRSAGAKAAEPKAQAAALDAVGKLEASSAEKAQKSAEFTATNDISKKQLAVSQGNLGVARDNQNLSERKLQYEMIKDAADRELRMQQIEIEARKLEKQGKNDQAKLVRERSVGGEARLVPVGPEGARPGERTLSKGGKAYRVEFGPLTDKRGDVWIPTGTESVVSDFQKSFEAGQKALAGLDELRALGPEWMSDTVNSDKLQKARVEIANSLTAMVQYGGFGVPQQHDLIQAAKNLGAGEAGQWKDTTASMNRAREVIIRNMNTSLRNRGYDRTWDGPPDPLTIPETKPSPTQAALTSLQEQAIPKSAQWLFSQGPVKGPIPLSEEQEKSIETLSQNARNRDPDALAALQYLVAGGATPAIRQRAAKEIGESRYWWPKDPPPDPPSAADEIGYDSNSFVGRFHQPVQQTLPSQRARNASKP